MGHHYKVMDMKTSIIMFSSTDPRSVITYLLEFMLYDRHRHAILEDEKQIGIAKLLKLKRNMDRLTGKKVK